MHTHLVQFQVLNREAFNTDPVLGYPAVWEAAFPAETGPFSPSAQAASSVLAMARPLLYNTVVRDEAFLVPFGNPAIIGGNPSIVPFLSGAPTPPDPEEVGWQDTARAMPGEVLRILVRFNPTDTPVINNVSLKGVNLYPFDPTAKPHYVWHCHIVDHEDNDMMRQISDYQVVYSAVQDQERAVPALSPQKANNKYMEERMVRISVVILSIVCLFSVCLADGPQLDKERLRESYSMGYEFGANVIRQEIDVDIDVLLSAARDALEGRKPALNPEEIRNALKDLKRKVTIAQDVRYRERMAKNLEEGRAFLEANKKREGVKTLPSGLQYIVLNEGDGPMPKATDMVKVNYRGTLIDGAEFDSSYTGSGPLIIHVNGMMRGWTEALQLMKVGSKWKIFVPTELAYGERKFSRIPPKSALIFEIELLAAGEDLLPREPVPNLPVDEDGPKSG